MALQASGQISFADINTELGRSSTAQIGLHEAETGTYGAINQSSTSKPNGSNPNAIDEWYSYDNSAVIIYTLGVNVKSIGTLNRQYVWWSTDGFVANQTKLPNAVTTSGGSAGGSGVPNITNGTIISFAIDGSLGPIDSGAGTAVSIAVGTYPTGPSNCSGNYPGGYVNYIVHASATIYLTANSGFDGAC